MPQGEQPVTEPYPPASASRLWYLATLSAVCSSRRLGSGNDAAAKEENRGAEDEGLVRIPRQSINELWFVYYKMASPL